MICQAIDFAATFATPRAQKIPLARRLFASDVQGALSGAPAPAGNKRP